MFQGSDETTSKVDVAAFASPPEAAATKATEPAPIKPRSLDEVRGAPRDLGINGVVKDDKGVEVEGAVCELYEDSSPSADRTEEGDLREKQVTNGRGVFQFDRTVLAAPDRFVLKVRHPSYGMERKPIDVTKAAPRPLVVMLRPGTTVSGTVRTVAGGAIPSVTVVVYDLGQAPADSNGSAETSAATDGAGAFSIGNVTPGRKRMVASLDDYATATMPEVRVENGNPLDNIGFVLNRGGAITGQVWAADGTPIGGAWVTARPTGEVSDSDVLRKAKFENAEEGREEQKSKTPLDKVRSKPQLVPTVSLRSTTLRARTRQDGTYSIAGTEFCVYAVTLIAPGFAEIPEQRVESVAIGANFTVPGAAKK